MNNSISWDASAATATLAREFLSYRINRFLHLHLGLMIAIGALALLAPPDAAAPGAAWWILNGMLYVGSLSALLLGLSSAQAEAEEFGQLLTQPVRIGWWVAGKCAGLAAVAVPAATLLILPTIVVAGGSSLLWGAAVAAAAITILMSWLGLALGFWIHDAVRGLISALVAWFALLFGVDLLLILVGGASWVHAQPEIWVAGMMLSPLDAYRVTLLFMLEHAAFDGGNLHPLTAWWVNHPVLWLAICVSAWCGAGAWSAAVGAERRRRA